MKKIIAAIVGMVMAAPGFAAFQYVSDGGPGTGYLEFQTNMSVSWAVDSSKANWGALQDFGYYNIDTKEFVSMKGGTAVDFKAGDKIGMWAKDSFGGTTTSTRVAGADWTGYSYLNGNGNFGILIGGVYPMYRSGEYQYVFNAAESGSGPSGQPLPGVLATLLVGGGVFAARKLRKK